MDKGAQDPIPFLIQNQVSVFIIGIQSVNKIDDLFPSSNIVPS